MLVRVDQRLSSHLQAAIDKHTILITVAASFNMVIFFSEGG